MKRVRQENVEQYQVYYKTQGDTTVLGPGDVLVCYQVAQFFQFTHSQVLGYIVRPCLT